MIPLFSFKRTSHGEVIPQRSPHVIGYGLLSEIEVSVEDPKATFCTKLIVSRPRIRIISTWLRVRRSNHRASYPVEIVRISAGFSNLPILFFSRFFSWLPCWANKLARFKFLIGLLVCKQQMYCGFGNNVTFSFAWKQSPMLLLIIPSSSYCCPVTDIYRILWKALLRNFLLAGE